jgi:hypothetical protein
MATVAIFRPVRSSAGEIAEFRQSGFTVRRGNNEMRAGIAAVTGRIETGGP